jgi:integrase
MQRQPNHVELASGGVPDEQRQAARPAQLPQSDPRHGGEARRRVAAKTDQPPLPEALTPHSLRRTFASLLYALGESPRTVMAEMGHADEGLALRVYAQTMRRDEDLVALRALVEGAEPGLARQQPPEGETRGRVPASHP